MGESRYLPERQNHVCCCQTRQGQEGILPPGHPQVRHCQQQGGRRQGWRARQARPEEDGRSKEDCGRRRRWQEGSRKLQAARQEPKAKKPAAKNAKKPAKKAAKPKAAKKPAAKKAKKP